MSNDVENLTIEKTITTTTSTSTSTSTTTSASTTTSITTTTTATTSTSTSAKKIALLPTLSTESNSSFQDVLIMGCSGFAGMYNPIDEESIDAAIRFAISNGIYQFDVAPHYGLGLAEERLGKTIRKLYNDDNCNDALASTLNLPQKLYFWTKAGRVIKHSDEVNDKIDQIDYDNTNLNGKINSIFHSTREDRIPVFDYSRDGCHQSFKDSLERIGLDFNSNESEVGTYSLRSTDLKDESMKTEHIKNLKIIMSLRMHDCEKEERIAAAIDPMTGGLKALIDMSKDMLIVHPSLGMNNPEDAIKLLKCCYYMEGKKHSIHSVMIAGCWNLLDQSGGTLLAYCEANDIEVHLAGVFASGCLAGGNTYKYHEASSTILSKVRRWKTLCDSFKLPLALVAIAFALLPKPVKKISIGMKSVEEVQQSIDWCKQALDMEVKQPTIFSSDDDEVALIMRLRNQRDQVLRSRGKLRRECIVPTLLWQHACDEGLLPQNLCEALGVAPLSMN